MLTFVRRLNLLGWGLLGLWAFGMSVITLSVGDFISLNLGLTIILGSWSILLTLAFVRIGIYFIDKQMAESIRQQQAQLAAQQAAEQALQLSQDAQAKIGGLIEQARIAQTIPEQLSFLAKAMTVRPVVPEHKTVRELIGKIQQKRHEQLDLFAGKADESLTQQAWADAQKALSLLCALDPSNKPRKLQLAEVQLRIALDPILSETATRPTKEEIEAVIQSARTLEQLDPDHELVKTHALLVSGLTIGKEEYLNALSAVQGFNWRRCWEFVVRFSRETLAVPIYRRFADEIAQNRGGWLLQTKTLAEQEGQVWSHAPEAIGLVVPDKVMEDLLKSTGTSQPSLPEALRQQVVALWQQIPPLVAATKSVSQSKGAWGTLITAAIALMAPVGGNGDENFVVYLKACAMQRPQQDPLKLVKLTYEGGRS